jgi:hypothetical protein
LALPATFLILFVTTLGLISITYYFAVERVNSRSQALKVVMAKQDFLSLDQNIMSLVWQPGSARTIEIQDSGGRLFIQPSKSSLMLIVSDEIDINETIYNENTGVISYELPYSDSPETGLFLKGDERTITNQSGSVVAQLFIRNGMEHPEIHLRYRPTVSYVSGGLENEKTINTIRIYVVNLNASDVIAIYGRVPLRISCEETYKTIEKFTTSYASEKLHITAIIDGDTGKVAVPVTSSAQGAVITIEIVECKVKIARSLM